MVNWLSNSDHVQLLSLVAKQPRFALKGGTAINLFVRDTVRKKMSLLSRISNLNKSVLLLAVSSSVKYF